MVRHSHVTGVVNKSDSWSCFVRELLFCFDVLVTLLPCFVSLW